MKSVSCTSSYVWRLLGDWYIAYIIALINMLSVAVLVVETRYNLPT